MFDSVHVGEDLTWLTNSQLDRVPLLQSAMRGDTSAMERLGAAPLPDRRYTLWLDEQPDTWRQVKALLLRGQTVPDGTLARCWRLEEVVRGLLRMGWSEPIANCAQCGMLYMTEQVEELICKHHPGQPAMTNNQRSWTCCEELITKTPGCQRCTHRPETRDTQARGTPILEGSGLMSILTKLHEHKELVSTTCADGTPFIPAPLRSISVAAQGHECNS